MNAYLVNVQDGTQHVLDARPQPAGDLYIALPVFPEREVSTARNLDRREGEGEYIAFLTYVHRDDHKQAMDAAFGPAEVGTVPSLMNAIFGGPDVEPELPCERIILDGVSVIKIDLREHVADNVLIIPESHYP